MRIIVVTDAISPGSYFPAWHNYYSGLFGSESIHVFTYSATEGNFAGFSVGGIHALPDGYDDDFRINEINQFIDEALKTVDIVVRIDVDEFLIADPAKYSSLLDCLKSWKGSHITAHGFDIFQSPDEAALDLGLPVMAQRKYGYALTALNKTCITRVPIGWGRGFHYCTLPPTFHDVFLFHMKRADIDIQVEWNKRMIREASDQQFIKDYYAWDLAEIVKYHSHRFDLPIVVGLNAMNRHRFDERFLDQIAFDPATRLFNGPYEIEDVNVEIPVSFRRSF